ncbi:hypothetical protein COV18_07170 [Candidatus Woesearchaeota archaeon CG10_big_fil_rev_8_21_14_0_10_37_12]|nr:MAG: hypothetical protein COV18_07170 [Candidatus Woesearchaeota archaeon CG10_big_fil_rev_8_21_14_0_10_37_12]
MTLQEVGLVFPIVRASALVSVLGGIMFFREERKEIAKKLIATLVIIVGVILLSGKYVLF